MKDLLKKVFKRWELFLVVFLVLEFVVFGTANPKFLRPQSIMNSIVNYISVCIISLFVTMVMITGGIDIQAPSIIGLTSIIIGVLWSDAGMNVWVAALIAVAAAAVCGALSGFFIAYCGVQPMVVTLGGSFLYLDSAPQQIRRAAVPDWREPPGRRIFRHQHPCHGDEHLCAVRRERRHCRHPAHRQRQFRQI